MRKFYFENELLNSHCSSSHVHATYLCWCPLNWAIGCVQTGDDVSSRHQHLGYGEHHSQEGSYPVLDQSALVFSWCRSAPPTLMYCSAVGNLLSGKTHLCAITTRFSRETADIPRFRYKNEAEKSFNIHPHPFKVLVSGIEIKGEGSRNVCINSS